jgi:hypothetical protein
MVKRTLAAALWFMAIAYAWNYVAAVLGISELPGLVLGAVAVVLIAGDPLHRIWSPKPTVASQAPEPALA